MLCYCNVILCNMLCYGTVMLYYVAYYAIVMLLNYVTCYGDMLYYTKLCHNMLYVML